MLVIGAILFTAVLALFVALLVNSRGTPAPFLGEDGRILPGSLSEKTFIEVNGTRQGMFIKSMNATNPVLLYLHGGMPDYFLTSRYPTRLESSSPSSGGNSAARGSPIVPTCPEGR